MMIDNMVESTGEQLPIKVQEDMNALKRFLLDIECLDPLSEYTNTLNIFDVLKITRTEIRHSNMLSWLLDPNENHGLGDKVLKGILQYYAGSFAYGNANLFSMLLMDCHDFFILREWRSIDILCVSEDNHFALCIENKIDSGEHDNQLNRYKKIVTEVYPEYQAAFLLLSPDGTEASDPDSWCSIGYTDVLNIIANALKRSSVAQENRWLIENYMDTVRRDIVGDEKIAKICAEIYAKHKRAIDLIIENMPDRTSEVTGIIRKWAGKKMENGDLHMDISDCTKTYTRFTTLAMSNILPDYKDTLGGWNSKAPYFYEIYNGNGEKIYMKLSLSSKNMSDEMREKCRKMAETLGGKEKENWQWWTLFSVKSVKIDEELTEEKLFGQLDKQFAEMMQYEKKAVNGFM